MGTIESKWGGGRIFALGRLVPRIADDVFLAPGVIVIGDVEIGAGSSIWFNSVLRADVDAIRIGCGTNIQDNCTIHVDKDFPAIIGDGVLVGHSVMLHGPLIRDRGFVGLGSTVLNGATIETDAMLGAGSLLTSGKTVSSGELWAGRPAKLIRPLNQAQLDKMRRGTGHYRTNALRYLGELREL
ncbi:MAG: gamma carbonic anhydrase family protein [Janthinobacterium lividum]